MIGKSEDQMHHAMRSGSGKPLPGIGVNHRPYESLRTKRFRKPGLSDCGAIPFNEVTPGPLSVVRFLSLLIASGRCIQLGPATPTAPEL